jgi:hypothetical protein
MWKLRCDVGARLFQHLLSLHVLRCHPLLDLCSPRGLPPIRDVPTLGVQCVEGPPSHWLLQPRAMTRKRESDREATSLHVGCMIVAHP